MSEKKLTLKDNPHKYGSFEYFKFQFVVSRGVDGYHAKRWAEARVVQEKSFLAMTKLLNFGHGDPKWDEFIKLFCEHESASSDNGWHSHAASIEANG